jgi:hypothetical protein
MSRVKVMKNKKQVASGKNLGVITRYQRTHSSVSKVSQKGRNLTVRYGNGASVKTKFASETVLKEWIRRKRVRGTFPKRGGGRPRKRRKR